MKKNYLFAALALALYTVLIHFRPSFSGESNTDFSPAVLRATDETFQQTTENTEWVLLDFWASWCGPCRRLKPEINTLATDYAGKVSVVALNVDVATQTASVFGVRSIPDLVLLRNGSVVARRVGYSPAPVLKIWIDEEIARR